MHVLYFLHVPYAIQPMYLEAYIGNSHYLWWDTLNDRTRNIFRLILWEGDRIRFLSVYACSFPVVLHAIGYVFCRFCLHVLLSSHRFAEYSRFVWFLSNSIHLCCIWYLHNFHRFDVYRQWLSDTIFVLYLSVLQQVFRLRGKDMIWAKYLHPILPSSPIRFYHELLCEWHLSILGTKWRVSYQ